MTIQEFVEKTGILVSSTDYQKYGHEELDFDTWMSLLTSSFDCF